MSDPSNPFKSLADSLLSQSGADVDVPSQAAAPSAKDGSVEERIEAFFSSELLRVRIGELHAIGVTEDPRALEFLQAVAEEDPDPLLRIASTIQLIRLGLNEEVANLSLLLNDEKESTRTYALGLMILDELPKPSLTKVASNLLEHLPEEASNQAALIQVIRDHCPQRLGELLNTLLQRDEGDFESLDEDVWNEFVYSNESIGDFDPELSKAMSAYLKTLAEDHPRRRDLLPENEG